jgi:hypothetical protein
MRDRVLQLKDFLSSVVFGLGLRFWVRGLEFGVEDLERRRFNKGSGLRIKRLGVRSRVQVLEFRFKVLGLGTYRLGFIV